MTRTIQASSIFLIILIAASFLVLFSENRHVEAPFVREMANDFASNGGKDPANGKRGIEIFYSAKMGTVLFLVRTTPNRAGGIIWRITSNKGAIPLRDNTYEATCFSCDYSYWSRVIFRDGYAELTTAIAAAVATASTGMITGLLYLSKKLRERNLDALADHLDQHKWNKE